MIILNDKQIRQKVKRLAYEIIEQNLQERDVWLLGINNNGLAFANILADELSGTNETKTRFHLGSIRLNPAAPLEIEIKIDVPAHELNAKPAIIIDDVANTGRTIFYALKPFMNILASRIQTAVLIDRQHKSFPISINFVGLSLATTIEDHIKVRLNDKEKYDVSLV